MLIGHGEIFERPGDCSCSRSVKFGLLAMLHLCLSCTWFMALVLAH